MPIMVFRLQQVLALFTPLTDTALVLESQFLKVRTLQTLQTSGAFFDERCTRNDCGFAHGVAQNVVYR